MKKTILIAAMAMFTSAAFSQGIANVLELYPTRLQEIGHPMKTECMKVIGTLLAEDVRGIAARAIL